MYNDDENVNNENNNSENVSEHGEEDPESDVDYPLIDLKTGLKNEIIERTLKDLKKAAKHSAKHSKSYSTESSRETLGRNKIAQFSLKKAINYFFSEHEFILDRVRKGQLKTFRDLQRIHLDKRKQIRMTYEYHREELRKEVLKLKNEDRFLREQQELEQAIRQKKMSINELIEDQRNLMKEISDRSQNKKKGIRSRPVEKEVLQPSSGDDVDEIVETAISDIPEVSKVQEQIQQSDLPRSRSFLQTKAIEVTKGLSQPRTVERSMDDRPIAITERSFGNKRQSVDNPKPLTNTDELPEVSVSRIENKRHEDVKASDNPLKLPAKVSRDQKPKTVKNLMKESKIKKEREIRETLKLPYVAYRRSQSGRLVALDHPPVTQSFNEPSNKEKYKMNKFIDEERKRYRASIINLTNTTTRIIEEEISKRNQIKGAGMETKGDQKFEARNIGIESWMKVFVSSNLPDDIDPLSPEAIFYCRYIRAPLEAYSHLPNYLIYHAPL